MFGFVNCAALEGRVKLLETREHNARQTELVMARMKMLLKEANIGTDNEAAFMRVFERDLYRWEVK